MATRRQRQQELAPLRREAKHALSLLRRKVNRVKNDLEVTSLGRHEPRVPDAATIDRYTEKQLQSFIAQSEAFRSRRTQFEKLGSGELITRQQWQEFARVQRKRDRQRKQAFDSIKDIYIPELGRTIGERQRETRAPWQDEMYPTHGGMKTTYKPHQIAHSDALDTLQQQMDAYNTGDEYANTRAQAMKSLGKTDSTFSAAGDPVLMQQIESLTDEQFFILWSIRDFTDNMFRYYRSTKDYTLTDNDLDADKQDVIEQVRRQDRDTLQGLIDRVKEIPGTGRRF